MKAFSATLPSGERVDYVDRKRYYWALSVLFPLQPVVGIGLHAVTGNEFWLVAGLVATYAVGPLADFLLGPDPNNPPEAVVRQLDDDRYYRRLTWLVVPLHVVVFFTCALYAGMADLSMPGFIGLAVVAGMSAGLAINTGHELGHKNSRFEKGLAKFVLALPAYGHFSLDHNRGHHRDVATPGDPASARMGETIYRFTLREIPGAFRRAWQIEGDRLRQRGKTAWHPSNALLQSWSLSLAIALALVAAFGGTMLAYLLVHHLTAYFQLTSANYIEHYGLLRREESDGRPERCAPHHSWNSNHVLSNLVLFHLERHSDHHANPLRRYQSLRHFEDLPQLPNGYFGMYLLAYIPPLWFRIMDPRLLALAHVQGDLSNVNLCPRARRRIISRYQAADPG
jgi:alkane 1-monooxygenase